MEIKDVFSGQSLKQRLMSPSQRKWYRIKVVFWEAMTGLAIGAFIYALIMLAFASQV